MKILWLWVVAGLVLPGVAVAVGPTKAQVMTGYGTTTASLDLYPDGKVNSVDVFLASDTPGVTPTGTSGFSGSRGYWTSVPELETMRQFVSSSREPYISRAKEMYKDADAAWPGLTSVGGVYTLSGSFDNHIHRGGYAVYAKALAFRLRGTTTDADFVRTKILDWTDVTSFSGAEGPIMLGWNLPAWIQAADLLEGYTGWNVADRRAFQRWLTDVPYKVCSLLGRTEDNNRGATCGYLNGMIADYVSDAGWDLAEDQPTVRRLSAATAYREYTDIQLTRMSYKVGRMNPGKTDACPINGIMSHGGIPAELRRNRGSVNLSWCNYEFLPDANNSAYTYQQTHLMGTIPHAELLLRRGDERMYKNIAADGTGSILRSIKFVIANPVDSSKSFDWTANKKTPLYMAYSYYKDADLRARLDGGTKNTNGVSFRGIYVYFAMLTHPIVSADLVIPRWIVSAP